MRVRVIRDFFISLTHDFLINKFSFSNLLCNYNAKVSRLHNLDCKYVISSTSAELIIHLNERENITSGRILMRHFLVSEQMKNMHRIAPLSTDKGKHVANSSIIEMRFS